MHGKVETFVSYEELMQMKELEWSELAEKVCNLDCLHSQILIHGNLTDSRLAANYPSAKDSTQAHSNHAHSK